MRRWEGILLLAIFALAFGGVAVAYAQNAPDKDFIYDDHGRRDPFGKLVSPNGVILTHENDLTAVDLSLEGILTDDSGKNIAIINSRVLKENDQLGSFVVLSITTDTVVLEHGQETITLKLKKED